MTADHRLDAALLTVAPDRAAADPAYVQIYAQLRALILSGRLGPGQRLPSSRAFAAELTLSRTTLVAAYELLASEGYIEARRGAGMFVSALAPEQLLLVQPDAAPNAGAPRRPSAPGAGNAERTPPPRPFTTGATETRGFPAQAWARLLQRSWREPDAALFHGQDGAGHARLRAAIAAHLGVWRGIACDAGRVIVTSGSAEAMDLIFDALAAPKARVWLEDPGYAALRRAVVGRGLEPVYLPVDAEGLVVAAGERAAPDARVAVVTPSRQYPLGMTLSLPRRLGLLEWAAGGEAWIVEDDYDSEFRYAGRPLAALMSLDETGRVLYMGSFSKVLFPTLRIGYLVAPSDAVAERLAAAQRARGGRASLVAQPALAELIDSGLFAGHLRRMRRLYARRRAALLEALAAHAGDLLRPDATPSGMHVVARLSDAALCRIDDRAASRRAAAAGIVAAPLSAYYAAAPPEQGLVLGFAGFEEAVIATAAERLAWELRG